LWQLRLSVDDYHRYIYPVSGRRSHERTINGVFHTVQPIALEHCPVYKENTRKYCIIKTNEFGTILMMEVGAMMVGRITNHEAEPGYVTRGEEKGYFEFGGSTIILLTQKGAVLPRKNIFFLPVLYAFLLPWRFGTKYSFLEEQHLFAYINCSIMKLCNFGN